MFKRPLVVLSTAGAMLSATLVSCDQSDQSKATPSPTPTPTPHITASPTPVAVAATATPLLSPSPSASIAAETTPAPTPVASVPPLPPVTDNGMLAGELSTPTLIGRNAEVNELKVDWLVGDRAFYVVIDGSNRRMLVILDTKLNKGAADAELKILPGQTLTIRGVIEKLPDAQELADRWGVRGKETDPLKGQVIYLHADKVTINKGPGAS